MELKSDHEVGGLVPRRSDFDQSFIYSFNLIQKNYEFGLILNNKVESGKVKKWNGII